MKSGSVDNEANLDEVLEGMMKNNEALKKHIDSNSSFELEETTIEDVAKQERIKEIDANLAVFAKESSRFKYIPNPENSRENEANFDTNIREVFKKVLPGKIIETLSSKKCGLCNEEFQELRWAHRHFTGYNHRGAIKSFIKGTLQTHPPYFKMVWQAILSKHPDGLTDIQIFVYIMQNFGVGEDIKKVEQFIQYGIERLLANEYIKKEADMFTVVDASRALDIKSGGARVAIPHGKKGQKVSSEEFETKFVVDFGKELPQDIVKTLKQDYCGLCHQEIKDSEYERHYKGTSHKKIVELYKTGQYLGHPSYSKMMEQYFANENPDVLSERKIVRFIMKNFKVEADEFKVHAKVQKVIKSILDKPDERRRERDLRFRDPRLSDSADDRNRDIFNRRYEHARRHSYRDRQDHRDRSRSRPRNRHSSSYRQEYHYHGGGSVSSLSRDNKF